MQIRIPVLEFHHIFFQHGGCDIPTVTPDRCRLTVPELDDHFIIRLLPVALRDVRIVILNPPAGTFLPGIILRNRRPEQFLIGAFDPLHFEIDVMIRLPRFDVICEILPVVVSDVRPMCGAGFAERKAHTKSFHPSKPPFLLC